ncbi:uncharacterized protein LOC118438073 [Folsomia candida]|nr:uncharacterized protein LOC118438073 [Folsomia candida]
MPSLSSLAIIMKDSKTWDLVWTDIFPHLDSTGERMVIPQIEELSISMVEDCDAAKIHRIQAIFPKLKKFCHFGEAENPELLPAVRFIPDPDRDPQILFVCRHDKHCRPRRDWWLDKKHAKRFCFYDYFANFENDLGYDV